VIFLSRNKCLFLELLFKVWIIQSLHNSYWRPSFHIVILGCYTMYDNCESKQKSISIIQSDMKVIHLGGKRIKMLQVNRKASWALLDFNLDLNHSTTTQREKNYSFRFPFVFAVDFLSYIWSFILLKIEIIIYFVIICFIIK
jgi:hypothetical protein